MRVLHAPVFDGNQYQKSLFKSLERQGVDVLVEDRAVPLSPFLHRVVFSDVDVLHLHWTHPYFLFGSKERLYRLPFSQAFCAVAAVVFLVQVWIASKVVDRVVWTVHNKCNHERRYESLDNWVSKQVVSIADAVQVWDSRTERELEQYLGETLPEVYQIPHGNYVDVYDLVPKTEARPELNLPRDERVYLYFGLIRPYKDVSGLISVFEELDDGVLVVAGNPKDARQAAKIRELAASASDVRLSLEYIPDEEVPFYFGAADCVVLPYRHIFNSGSALLAMSMERAVVAPSEGSIPSVLPRSNITYENLREGMLKVAKKSRDELAETGQLNRQVAEQEFDWDDVTERVVGMYRGSGST